MGQLCQRAGLGDEPRRVLQELAELRVVDVILPTRDGIELRQRCVTQPSDHQKILLQHLGWHPQENANVVERTPSPAKPA